MKVHNLTVKEFIDRLKECPQDAIINIIDNGRISDYVEVNVDNDGKKDICYIETLTWFNEKHLL